MALRFVCLTCVWRFRNAGVMARCTTPALCSRSTKVRALRMSAIGTKRTYCDRRNTVNYNGMAAPVQKIDDVLPLLLCHH